MAIIEFVDEGVGFDKAIVQSALAPAAAVIALSINAINIDILHIIILLTVIVDVHNTIDLIVAAPLLEILLKEGGLVAAGPIGEVAREVSVAAPGPR